MKIFCNRQFNISNILSWYSPTLSLSSWTNLGNVATSVSPTYGPHTFAIKPSELIPNRWNSHML